MTVSTLFCFLAGQRTAILQIAETKSAVWLGLLFVVSAGFAREYDGEDLLHEPWHLALPLAASLATSFLLFCLVWLSSRKTPDGASFFPSYRMFLGLYWMTAPLAWLYALPVERWMTPADATRANLWLLAIVAAWRVALMIRVVAVVFQARAAEALPIVMLFADTVLLVLLKLTPLPVFVIMGGIRLTDSEQLIQSTAYSLGAVGVLTWPIWLILAVFYRGRLSRHPAVIPSRQQRVSVGAWSLGLASVLVWIPILPSTQHEQRLRYQAESALRAGRIEAALAMMSQHLRSDFPPHWDPPPRIGYGESDPPIASVIEAILNNHTAAWVDEIYLQKFEDSTGDGYGTHYFWNRLEPEEFDKYLGVLEQLSDRSIVERHREALATQLGQDSNRTEAQQERVRALIGEEEPVAADR